MPNEVMLRLGLELRGKGQPGVQNIKLCPGCSGQCRATVALPSSGFANNTHNQMKLEVTTRCQASESRAANPNPCSRLPTTNACVTVPRWGGICLFEDTPLQRQSVL